MINIYLVEGQFQDHYVRDEFSRDEGDEAVREYVDYDMYDEVDMQVESNLDHDHAGGEVRTEVEGEYMNVNSNEEDETEVVSAADDSDVEIDPSTDSTRILFKEDINIENFQCRVVRYAAKVYGIRHERQMRWLNLTIMCYAIM